jgi:hypothetical protein
MVGFKSIQGKGKPLNQRFDDFYQMECPICTSTKGLKDRQELVRHM